MTADDQGTRRRPSRELGRLPDRSLSRVVLIGVGAYRSGQLENVPAAANNVHQLLDVLTGAHGGFAAEHCAVLVDWDDPGRIGAALETAAQQSEDVLLIYFAGHGLLGPGAERPELFLALPGTDPGLPAYSALPFSAIRETFGRSRAQVKILILDCCYSGLAIGRPLSGPGPGDPDEFAIKGAAILVSSGPYELSWVRDGHPLTAFTGALVSVLRDGIPGAGPLLSLTAVADQTKRRLITEKLPAPRRLEVGDAGALALVRNQCGNSGKSHLPPVARPPVARPPVAYPRIAPSEDDSPDRKSPRADSGPAVTLGRADGAAAVLAGRRARAERIAREGDPRAAGSRLHELVADAERLLGPLAPETLRGRLALARWLSTQHDGDAIATVRRLTELERDLAAVLGPYAPETKLCRSLRDSRDLRRRETDQVISERPQASP
jgi:hypothetical protein